LYQGGAELAFDVPTISRELVVTIQGLVILFSGALAYMSTPWITRVYRTLTAGRVVPAASGA
jgi:simple sugar transport system permease protein